MSLADFLAAASRTPFAWGTFDCCLWLADWLVARGYPDPAVELRGRYRTARTCQRLVARNGGLLATVEACARRARLELTAAPISGDVGVVEALTRAGAGPVGALCLGRRWAILGERGLIVAEMRPLAAWRVA